MSWGAAQLTVVGLLKISFPAHTVRLCDGGFCDWDGERYTSVDPVFGTIGAVDAVEQEIGDFAPGGGFTLLPAPDAPLSVIHNPENQNSRVQMWFGYLGGDGKTVSTAEVIFDGFVDTTMLTLTGETDELAVTYISRAEKLFQRSEGNVLASAFHQSVWPGERGLDNCTDLAGFLAWGIEAPPRGTVAGVVAGVNRPGGFASAIFGRPI